MEEINKFRRVIHTEKYEALDQTSLLRLIARIHSNNDHLLCDQIEALEHSSITNPTIWLLICRNVIRFLYVCAWLAGGKNGPGVYTSPRSDGEVFSKPFVCTLKNLLKFWSCGDSIDIFINGISIKTTNAEITTPKLINMNTVYLRIFITEILKNSLALGSKGGHRNYKQGKIVNIQIKDSELTISDKLEKPLTENEARSRENYFQALQESILGGNFNYDHCTSLAAISYFMHSAGFNLDAGFKNGNFTVHIKKN